MGPPGRFVRGFGYGFRGLLWMRRHPKLARYWLPPLVLTTLVFAGLQVVAFRWFDALLASVWHAPKENSCGGWDWVTSWSCLVDGMTQLLYGAAGFLAWLVAATAAVLLTFLVSLLVAAPFNDSLSEAVERVSKGQVPGRFSLGAVLRDGLRSVVLESGKLALYVAVMAPLFVLSWLVPGVGQTIYTAVGGLLTVSYFALDFTDWPMARREWSVRRRVGLLKEQTALLLGFGSAVWVLLFVPVLSLLLMPAAVIGGTLLFLDLEPDPQPSPTPPVNRDVACTSNSQ